MRRCWQKMTNLWLGLWHKKSILVNIVVFMVIVGCLVGIFIGRSPEHSTEIKDTIHIEQVITMDSIQPLSIKDSVFNHLFELRAEHIDIVISQAIIESATFSSKIFKENNNHFGMKIPSNRPTTAIGVKNGHAVYRSWQDCNIDYILWQACYARKLDRESYLNRLKSYAQDPNYVEKIRKMSDNETNL